jgi:hypothetical protein
VAETARDQRQQNENQDRPGHHEREDEGLEPEHDVYVPFPRVAQRRRHRRPDSLRRPSYLGQRSEALGQACSDAGVSGCPTVAVIRSRAALA